MTSLGIGRQGQAGGRCGQECVFVQGGGHWHGEDPEEQGALEVTATPTLTSPILPHTLIAQNCYR